MYLSDRAARFYDGYAAGRSIAALLSGYIVPSLPRHALQAVA